MPSIDTALCFIDTSSILDMVLWCLDYKKIYIMTNKVVLIQNELEIFFIALLLNF